MKVIATSDLHGTLPDVPECDLLLLGGDLCPDFVNWRTLRPAKAGKPRHTGEHQQANWLRDTLIPWLVSQPAEQIVMIAGNHDFVFEKRFLLPGWPTNVTYLQDETVERCGLRIHGLPWVPNLPMWAFYGDERKLSLSYAAVPPCDILMSHGPPHGALDLVGARYGFNDEGRNVGSHEALTAIYGASPEAFVCGHIHEAHGVALVGDTTVYNVALNDETYNPIHSPVELDL